jgi:hypothetical protein
MRQMVISYGSQARTFHSDSSDNPNIFKFDLVVRKAFFSEASDILSKE